MNPNGRRFIPLGRLLFLVQAVAALVFVVYILAGDGVRVPLLAADRPRLEVELADAGGLNSEDHHPVTVAGVEVGEVVEVREERGLAVATLELADDAHEQLGPGASARIEPRSALSDLVVEVDPGAAAGDAPRRIRAGRSAGPVSLDRVLRTLDADTRAQLQILLGELDAGLSGRSTALRRALGRLDATLASTSDVTAALAERRRLLARLVGGLETVFTTLADRREALREAIRSGRATLTTTAARERELSVAIRELPQALAAVDSSLAEVRGLAVPLEPALSGLRPFARELPGGLRRLRDLVPAARGLVRDLAPVVGARRASVRDLRRALTGIGPAARGLTPAVEDLLPILREFDANKEGIGTLGERFSGVFSTNDANGPILRGLGFFEDFNPANFGMPGASGAGRVELAAQAALALERVCLDENPAACLARYLVPGLPGAVRGAAR